MHGQAVGDLSCGVVWAALRTRLPHTNEPEMRLVKRICAWFMSEALPRNSPHIERPPRTRRTRP